MAGTRARQPPEVAIVVNDTHYTSTVCRLELASDFCMPGRRFSKLTDGMDQPFQIDSVCFGIGISAGWVRQ